MKKILVVEDEDAIRDFVVINLKRAGYEVTEASSGEEAISLYEAADGQFDVALLDIMLPGIDGIEVCRRIRSRSGVIGIIMLTARTQDADKIIGLSSGADDYITKPFSPAELVARVEALYRRVSLSEKDSAAASKKLRSGEYELDLRNRSIKRGGNSTELTQVEFQIMEYFFENPGVALERTDILTRVWGEGYYGEEKIVDVNIRRLRMKIEDDPSSPRHIVTVWGLGYKWEV